MDTGVLAARADATNAHGLADRAAYVAGPTPVDLATDALDAGSAAGREPAPSVTFVGAPLPERALVANRLRPLSASLWPLSLCPFIFQVQYVHPYRRSALPSWRLPWLLGLTGVAGPAHGGKVPRYGVP